MAGISRTPVGPTTHFHSFLQGIFPTQGSNSDLLHSELRAGDGTQSRQLPGERPWCRPTD